MQAMATAPVPRLRYMLPSGCSKQVSCKCVSSYMLEKEVTRRMPASCVLVSTQYSCCCCCVCCGCCCCCCAAVSKLLDMELFPAEPAFGVVAALPHLKLLKQRTVPHHHHLHPDLDFTGGNQVAAAAARKAESSDMSGSITQHRSLQADEQLIHDELTEVCFEVYTAKPCWGTLRLSGVEFVSWSMIPGVWNDAASFTAGDHRGSGRSLVTKQGTKGFGGNGKEDWGNGTVRNVVVKWTSEQQQAALRWPIRVRFYSSKRGQKPGHEPRQVEGEGAGAEKQERSGSSGKTGLGVELHVGYVERTEALAAVQARMPEWSTLTYEATTYVSKWEF